MKRRYWLLPPLLALAGYFYAGPIMPAPQNVEEAPRTTDTRDLDNSPGIPLRQALQAATEDWSENLPSPGELEERARLGDLKQRLESLTDMMPELRREQDELGIDHHFLGQQFHAILTELIRREGAAGYAWIEQRLPRLRLLAMDKWTEENQEAALKAILSSDRRPPCDIRTMSAILKRMILIEDPALVQVCRDVPWDLFRYCDFDALEFRPQGNPRSGNYLDITGLDDHAACLESGALSALAGQGVELPHFFSRWSEKDPLSALQAWSDLPETGLYSRDLFPILNSCLRDRIRSPVAIAFVRDLRGDRKERMKAEIRKMLEQHPDTIMIARPFTSALGLPPGETRR